VRGGKINSTAISAALFRTQDNAKYSSNGETMPKTNRYIPDHIRRQRTDRLVHYRESLLLIATRYLPTLWENPDHMKTVNWCYRELIDISEILHRRAMHHDKAHRAARDERYQADWR
jgi:hypothetical protein